MPSPIKFIRNKDVLFITTRTEEGLPFVCTPFMEAILKSCLARAQTLHQVRVCHFGFFGNHLHLIALVDNPDDIPAFMDRLKTESAHAINKLLGNRKRTVWCDGYDSPIICEPERVVEDIAYLYANPAEADLVESIDDYPGCSSWSMYQTAQKTYRTKWIRRPTIKKMNNAALPIKEQEKFRDYLLEANSTELDFELHPDAWLESFGLQHEAAQWNGKIRARIRELEQAARERRAKVKRPVLSAARLKGQTMQPHYRPKKFGKRMYVRCSNLFFRKKLLTELRELRSKAREVYRRWRDGDFSMPYPIGLFPPCRPKICNVLRSA